MLVHTHQCMQFLHYMYTLIYHIPNYSQAHMNIFFLFNAHPSQVAARVRTEDGEEQWILAEVFSYNSHNHRYSVDDIDEEGHNEQR